MASKKIETPAAKKARLAKEAAARKAKQSSSSIRQTQAEREAAVKRVSNRAQGGRGASTALPKPKPVSGFGAGAMAGGVGSRQSDAKVVSARAKGNLPAGTTGNSKKAPKSKPAASTPSPAKSSSPKPKAKTSEAKAAVGGSAAPISQSDTRWVKKAGQRGYVEQISTGKRVTGKVTLVSDTTKGKAGQTRVYKGGKDVTKGKK